MKYKVNIHQGIADLHTPVGTFMKLRDHFAQVLLLESSDYSSKENAQSIICFNPLESITIFKDHVELKNHVQHTQEHKQLNNAVQEVDLFIKSLDIDGPVDQNGVFGYTTYDAVTHFDKNLYNQKESIVPHIHYAFYRFLFIIDHFNDTYQLIENCPNGASSQIESILNLIDRQDIQSHPFQLSSERAVSNLSDEDFMDIVKKCKAHCQRGDVFQIVPSRKFTHQFKGDEFNVYRRLRTINPSPYLFYFDYGNYKIFGSSPEVQIKVEDGEAEVHPIAGTVKRTGDTSADNKLAQQLFNDPKENAEHIMLVDLARNDLSKNCNQVLVDKYKEIQYFSHVIHLTSIVKGQMKSDTSPYQILADTFPAGTLSGAPKHKAISIIEEVEPEHRGFYGGAVGMIGFNQNLNHAIIIRSFVSTNYTLTLQAGAGIVIASTPEGELQEVNNKLAALEKALNAASNKI